MPTLGEELKRRREERDISLADISEATRIGTRFLKAIESDNFSVLPGGIFTRSFIRAYAKQVGMDEDEALVLYQQQTAALTPEPQTSTQAQADQRARQTAFVEQPVARHSAEPRARRSEPMAFRQSSTRASWSTIIIAGGIALFVVIIVLALVKQLNRASNESAQQAAQRAAAQPAPSQEPQAAQPAQPVSQSAPEPAAETPPANVAQGEPLVAKIEATIDNCSIQYWIDDAAKPISILVRKGESQDLPPALNQIKFNIGNRPALKLKINNRDITFPEGTPLWGAKVTISRDNLQTFVQ